jgi:hypothetical protein
VYTPRDILWAVAMTCREMPQSSRPSRMLSCIASTEGAVRIEDIRMGRREPPACLGIRSRIEG